MDLVERRAVSGFCNQRRQSASYISVYDVTRFLHDKTIFAAFIHNKHTLLLILGTG